MPRLALSFAAVAALTLAADARAQARTAAASDGAAARGKLGFGIGVSAHASTSVDLDREIPARIYVPIQLSQTFRIEPEVGIATFSTPGTDGAAWSIGSGFFLTQPLAPTTLLYVGPRLVLGFDHAKQGGLSGTGVDLGIVAAVGGEQFLSDHFSLGAEASLGYVYRPEVSDRGIVLLRRVDGFTTQGILFVRVYL